MNYLYSAVENRFYPYALKEAYEQSGIWPDKGVIINDEKFQSLINPAEGKQVSSGPGGYPVLIDMPPLSSEQIRAEAELERKVLLEVANSTILPWQVKIMLGRASEEVESNLNKWLDYMDAVLETETSTTSKTKWPSTPQPSAPSI